MLVTSIALALSSLSAQAAPVVGTLNGSTEAPQWEYRGSSNEWFSRYSSLISSSQLQAFKNQPTVNTDLFATRTTVRVSYLGTGAARDSNLFLAGTGSFNTSSFWNPVYASGGTNNRSIYDPVNSGNLLFNTRAGCSYQQAKRGNSCLISELGLSREISGLTTGEELVFGLQALPLVFDGINIPNTHYFFAGAANNNRDAKGWDDGSLHAKLLDLGDEKILVGFEDTWLGAGSSSDRDYNDMIFLFEGVSNKPDKIPEPAGLALLLGGLGLLGATRVKSRRR
ncbi:DUF4114 domain-containing protein [Niveibacterium terrae]|uniref:DUF4114 domain-containing protein n=1 Tax=Niveibacterium terrae TaxID=3373598 RepID=UPI003A8EDEBE